jgi:hypothetical protein
VRTTLNIDDDVLAAAKDLAARQRTTAGRILSEQARSALASRKRSPRERNGVPILLKRRATRLVTPEIVNRLRDEI